MNKYVWLLYILCFACCNTDERHITSNKMNENNITIQKFIDSLKSGDMVLRLGNDMTSTMLSQLNFYDKSFSHCGIVVMEHNYPFIIHSIGGEWNPDQTVQKDSAVNWISPDKNLIIGIARWDLDKAVRDSFIHEIKKYYNEKKKFDMAFDLKTDHEVYCAEMIYKAMLTATHDSNFFNLTEVFGEKYIGIDNLFLSSRTNFFWKQQYK